MKKAKKGVRHSFIVNPNLDCFVVPPRNDRHCERSEAILG